MLISSQANPSFKHDIDAILNYAEVIGKEVFNNRGITDEVVSVSILRCRGDILVELDDDYGTGLEFPVEYLSLTLDEIRVKEEEIEEERRKKEKIRLEQQRLQDIESCKRTVQFCENSIKQAKLKYKQLTGENYGEPNT